jgi:5-methylthioadenosine/S-adenosylhomocysteine deaminase
VSGTAPGRADLLVTGAHVLTFDARGRVIDDGAVAVRGDRIAWVGSAREAKRRWRARETLHARGRTLMPGLVDTHFHTAQQFLRGKLFQLARRRKLRQPPWRNYYVPFEAMLREEDVYLSGLCAYTAMISVGTTCFLESGGPHPDAMGRAADEVGIRGVLALSTIDMDEAMPKPMRMTTRQALRANEALVRRWKKHPRVKAWPALRQIMVCSEALQRDMAALAKEERVRLHTHLAEGTYEVDFALARWGMRPVEYLESLGVFGPHLHTAHAVLVSNEELELYAKRKVSVAHCAFNNYHIGQPRALEMWRRGVPVGLGTDGAGSWGPLDIFQVAHAARIGQQLVAGTPNYFRGAVSSDEILQIAVRGGARVAGMADSLGAIEAGRKADFILLEASDHDQYPFYDAMFTASSASTGRDVRTVVIDGRVVMKEREILTVDVEKIRARLARHHPRLMARFDAEVA